MRLLFFSLVIASFPGIFLLLKKSFFSGKIKIFHLVLIWVIPFFGILILKSLTKPAPGSYEVEKRELSTVF
ncbi:MAG TPA: hypothetical protein VLS85_11785 [Hanamia sp.]|nr:hypothetical protein [Hanamia sp.]